MSSQRFALLPTFVLLAGALASGQAPNPELLGDIDFNGDWQRRGSFSAIAKLSSFIFLGGDEGSSIQIGTAQVIGLDAYDFLSRVELPAALGDGPVDIEALTVGDGYVYAIGSYAKTRKGVAPTRPQAANRTRLATIETHPRRDGVFRFRLDGGKGDVAELSRLDPLRGFIDTEAILGDFAPLASLENGVEIEGLAYHGGLLYAGFRGPVLRNDLVPVVRFPFDKIGDKTLLFVRLDGRGIRDLVRVSDGFLVLAGPVGGGNEPHDVFWWDGLDCVPGNDVPACVVTHLGSLARAVAGRAEGLFVTSETTDAYELLVVYEGALTGKEGSRFRLLKVL